MDQTNQQPNTEVAQGQQAAPTPVSPVPEVRLPDGVSERTSEQFEKLTDSNRRLNEVNQSLLQKINELSMSQQQPATRQEVEVAAEDFFTTDPQTGETLLDQQKLKKTIEETKRQAVAEAKKEVESLRQQQEQREVQRQTEEAYSVYPNLNPDSKEFDKELSRKTRAFILDSMMHPGDYKGRPLSFKEAADLAAVQQQKETVKNEKQEIKEQVTQTAEGTSSSAQMPQQSADEELSQLRMRSRKGGSDAIWAIAQRLSKIPHTGTPTSSTE